MSRDEANLLDIVAAARLCREFVQGMDREAFLEDVKTRSAVLHQLLVLGEATKRLSDGFRAAHPEIPWRAISGMRDRLIHAYDAVDLDIVWSTLDREIPKLLEALADQSLPD